MFCDCLLWRNIKLYPTVVEPHHKQGLLAIGIPLNGPDQSLSGCVRNGVGSVKGGEGRGGGQRQ